MNGEHRPSVLFDSPQPREPFCAGVLVREADRVLLALADYEEWILGTGGVRIPVRRVGGGQRPRETMPACAQREAREEIASSVILRHARVTFVEARGELKPIHFNPAPAPVLYQILRREATTPLGPGLPAGRWLHMAIYLAEPSLRPMPGDVPGLLWMPLAAIGLLRDGVSCAELPGLGGELLSGQRFTDDTEFFIPAPSTEEMLCRVIDRFGVSAL